MNLVLLLYIVLFAKASFARDSLLSDTRFLKKYLGVVSSSSGKISRQMDKNAQMILTRFRKQEDKLIRKLSKDVSVADKQMMLEAKARCKVYVVKTKFTH